MRHGRAAVAACAWVDWGGGGGEQNRAGGMTQNISRTREAESGLCITYGTTGERMRTTTALAVSCGRACTGRKRQEMSLLLLLWLFCRRHVQLFIRAVDAVNL